MEGCIYETNIAEFKNGGLYMGQILPSLKMKGYICGTNIAKFKNEGLYIWDKYCQV